MSGVAEMMIQNQGDWLSNAYKGYIVLSEAQQLQTSQRMADRIRVGGPDCHKILLSVDKRTRTVLEGS